MGGGSAYLHGTSREEQRRLALLNRLVNDRSLRELRLRKGARVLEVGSGLGDFALAMAPRLAPGGRVLGIERSRRQLRIARRRKSSAGTPVEFRQGDARRLPLGLDEWGRFDVAHARFLLEHLSDPREAVEQMMLAVRPGGRIVLEDDDHDVLRLDPEPTGFRRLWRAYIDSFRLLGNDPLVGRKLVRLLTAAGARPRRNTWIFFGSCAGHPDFPAYLANLHDVIAGARDPIVSRRLLDASSFRSSLSALKDWGARPDASIWYSIAWAEGIRCR
jgi:SAM-dependent methyltransferase